MLASKLENVRSKKPLIHNITNYVTSNDCANILLACGASPIMAEDEHEVEEVTAACNGLSINIGTPSPEKFAAILKAGKKANQIGIPVVLDPVGVGVSRFRKDAVRELLNNVHFDVIRGNMSEIQTLIEGRDAKRGVDSNEDMPFKLNPEYRILLKYLTKNAATLDAIVVMTGEMDYVADSKNIYLVSNGDPMMREVTGCGCQLSSLIAAFLAANRDQMLEATVAAVSSMGLAGEIAHNRLTEIEGNATYRNYIIDAIYRMDGESLNKKAVYTKIL